MGGNLLMGKENGVMEIRNMVFLLWGYYIMVSTLYIEKFTEFRVQEIQSHQNNMLCAE